MPRPFSRSLRRAGARLLTRRGLRGAGVATAATVATALLTAGSQAPGLQLDAGRAARDDGLSVPGGFVGPDVPLPDVPSQGDNSYHVELPPLKGVSAAEKVGGQGAHPRPFRVRRGAAGQAAEAHATAQLPVNRRTPRRTPGVRSGLSCGSQIPAAAAKSRFSAASRPAARARAAGRSACVPTGTTTSR